MEAACIHLDQLVPVVGRCSGRCSHCRRKWEGTGLQLLKKTCWDMVIADMVGGAFNQCGIYRYTSSGEVTAIDKFSQFLHSAICCSMPVYASVCIR